MSEAFSIARELFHQAALVAFVEASQAQGGWPHPNDVRSRAYAHYERELASDERNRSAPSIDNSLSTNLSPEELPDYSNE